MTTAVILCTYNGEKYISHQLDTLINQTQKPDKIFIGDDRSTDNTYCILQNYKNNYSPIIELYQNENNLGYRKNFESLLLKAKDYDIIFFCDQDDDWLPNKIETISNKFTNNLDTLLVFSNANIVDENLVYMGKTLFDDFFPYKLQKIFKKHPTEILTKGCTITGCTLAIRNNLIRYIVPFSNYWVHDEWIGALAPFFGTVDFVSIPLINYRQHKNQQLGISQKHKKNKTLQEWFQYIHSEGCIDNELEIINNAYIPQKELSDKLNTYGFKSKTVDEKIVFFEEKKGLYKLHRIFRFFVIIKLLVLKKYKKAGFPLKSALKDILIKKDNY